ncbi:preprotein translocase subunit SecY [Candidatus Woesearchaeota archaeon]|nr:MAG: preprotein translocase subunit SecY [Candidatus Woesearchaeota archaeon]
MAWYNVISDNLPEVASPTQKRLSFKEKLKWTLIVLVAFFVLGSIPLFGLDPQNTFRFEQLEVLLGASFGSLISLGIGPIVTASIVLQLLNGTGILKFDLTQHEGKKNFQSLQKVMALFFILLEGAIYVFMGGLGPPQQFLGTTTYFYLQLVLIAQLLVGGILILLMDELVSKWGFGSGISLFIAAGVSKQILIGLLSPFTSAAASGGGIGFFGYPFGGEDAPVGAIWQILHGISQGIPQEFALAIAAIVATVAIFLIAIFVQSMKVEIPLSFGRIRGHGIRWPLSFMYTSNIPVILIAALLANIQLFTSLFGISQTSVAWLNGINFVQIILTRPVTMIDIGQALLYMLILIVGSVIFAVFWVQSAGLDAKSQAKQMMASGLQIPGFRRDPRVLERMLKRYIGPLTVMGAIAVGILAALADLSGALGRGTGILLTVMIIYRLYEDIARQHLMDMNPMMRKFMGG